MKNDVLNKFIRDNYDVKKPCGENQDYQHDGQNADNADNLDDDEHIMMEVSDSEDPEQREDSHISDI